MAWGGARLAWGGPGAVVAERLGMGFVDTNPVRKRGTRVQRSGVRRQRPQDIRRRGRAGGGRTMANGLGSASRGRSSHVVAVGHVGQVQAQGRGRRLGVPREASMGRPMDACMGQRALADPASMGSRLAERVEGHPIVGRIFPNGGRWKPGAAGKDRVGQKTVETPTHLVRRPMANVAVGPLDNHRTLHLRLDVEKAEKASRRRAKVRLD